MFRVVREKQGFQPVTLFYLGNYRVFVLIFQNDLHYRGFCFLEYESHKAASLAKRRLETGRVKVWSCDIIVDWADPQEEADEDTMSQVKVLYVNIHYYKWQRQINIQKRSLNILNNIVSFHTELKIVLF